MPNEKPPVRVLRDLGPSDVGLRPVFNPGQAAGAFLNGSRVKKSRNDPGDTHTVGDCATVLASNGPINGEYFYFVEWDDLPGVPVGIRGGKLAAL